jgi:hypothetical protein
MYVASKDNNITPRELMAVSNEHLVSVIVLEDADHNITHAPYKYMIMAQTIATHNLTFVSDHFLRVKLPFLQNQNKQP